MFLFELTDAVDMLVTLVCFTIVIEDSELLCQQGHVSGINICIAIYMKSLRTLPL